MLRQTNLLSYLKGTHSYRILINRKLYYHPVTVFPSLNSISSFIELKEYKLLFRKEIDSYMITCNHEKGMLILIQRDDMHTRFYYTPLNPINMPPIVIDDVGTNKITVNYNNPDLLNFAKDLPSGCITDTYWRIITMTYTAMTEPNLTRMYVTM